jgi:hypothetical protein
MFNTSNNNNLNNSNNNCQNLINIFKNFKKELNNNFININYQNEFFNQIFYFINNYIYNSLIKNYEKYCCLKIGKN